MSENIRLYNVADVVKQTRLSRSKVYEEFDSGRLQSVKVGRRRLLTESQLSDFINTLIEVGTTDERLSRTPVDALSKGDAAQRSAEVMPA